MGLAHSPRIVMDGLTLLLDAANVKSYPGSGETWYDLSKYKNHVTLNNTSFDTKDNNKAIYFNGANAYGSFTTQPTVAQSTYSSTIICIAYREVLDGSLRVMFGGHNSNALNQGIYFGFRPTTDNFMYAYYANDQDGSTPSSTVAWNHYAATYNTSASSRYRFFNGQLLSPFQDSGVAQSQNTYWAIGAHQQDTGIGYYFKGWISVFMVYDRALNGREINQNLNAFRGRFSNL